MKALNFCIGAVMMLLFFTACTSDTPSPDNTTDGYADVRISLSAGSLPTRSASGKSVDWTDQNTEEGELMRNCFVLVVQNGNIVSLLQSKDYPKEQSDVNTLTARIPVGTTTFYSFANIRPSDIGIDTTKTYPQTLPPDFNNRLFSVSGNCRRASGFANGIPMSNCQTIDILPTTQRVDLEVVRMVAKVRLMLSNVSANDMTIRSVSLRDITANATDNLYLLPKTDADGSVVPNISPTAARTKYTVELGDTMTVKAGGKDEHMVEFYINESQANTPKYFIITVNTDQPGFSRRVAMMQWGTISRGDLLIIPIKLNDYRVRFEVEQFTAIGVLPDVQNTDSMLTVHFHSYGEFHIRPHVIRASDGQELTAGTDESNGWLLDDWATLELNPAGDAGTCIYDRIPTPIVSSHTFEGVMGNRSGYALHQMLFSVSGLGYQIPYKIQIIKE